MDRSSDALGFLFRCTKVNILYIKMVKYLGNKALLLNSSLSGIRERSTMGGNGQCFKGGYYVSNDLSLTDEVFVTLLSVYYSLSNLIKVTNRKGGRLVGKMLDY